MPLWCADAGNLSTSPYLNFLLISLPLFLIAYVTPFVMDQPRLGRRGALLCFFGMAVVAIICGVAWPVVATASSMVGSFAAEGAFAVIYLQASQFE